MARTLKDDHQGRLWDLVLTFPNDEDSSDDPAEYLPDLSRIDREQISQMVAHLQGAERTVRDLRRHLEAARDHREVQRCAECGRSVTGRAEKKYCGATCRQRAKRRSA